MVSLLWLVIAVALLQVSSREFDPYVDNGGTVVGLAGKDYCIMAADTRLSEQYSIRSRSVSRLFEIDGKSGSMILSATGCWSDAVALSKVIEIEAYKYEWMNDRRISLKATSHLVSSVLYSRRFFPFYSFCTIGGLDEKGVGALYRYDAIGSFERVQTSCSGKGEYLIQPILDELTDMEEDDSLWRINESGDSFESISESSFVQSLSCEEAVKCIVRAFRAAAEREISVGDGLEVLVLRRVPQSQPLSSYTRTSQLETEGTSSISIDSSASSAVAADVLRYPLRTSTVDASTVEAVHGNDDNSNGNGSGDGDIDVDIGTDTDNSARANAAEQARIGDIGGIGDNDGHDSESDSNSNSESAEEGEESGSDEVSMSMKTGGKGKRIPPTPSFIERIGGKGKVTGVGMHRTLLQREFYSLPRH